MQKTIDNLLEHHLIKVDEQEEIKNILVRITKENEQDEIMRDMIRQFTGTVKQSSNKPIFDALQYLECVRYAGKNDPDPVRSYLHQRKPKQNPIKQNSINADLEKYLNQLNLAGLISSTIYSECKVRINRGNLSDKFDLLSQLSIFSSLAGIADIDSMLSEKRKSYLTNNQIEDAIIGWKESGILNHLTTEQIEAAKKKALESDNENLNDVVLNFPNVVHWFDAELENLKDPYAELLQKISNISHGVFKPTNISDNFNMPINATVTVKFSLDNKDYSKTLQLQEDWIDTDFFDYVKQVVQENKLEGQCYELYEGGQGGIIIFLTPKQYQYLKTNKLLVFTENE
ncbi:MAG TPA: hypothetical protein VGG71_14205 [Chitinophagaceae bacterium]